MSRATFSARLVNSSPPVVDVPLSVFASCIACTLTLAATSRLHTQHRAWHTGVACYGAPQMSTPHALQHSTASSVRFLRFAGGTWRGAVATTRLDDAPLVNPAPRG